MPIGIVNEAVVQLEAFVGVRSVHVDIGRPQTPGPSVNVISYECEDDAAGIRRAMRADTQIRIGRHTIDETGTLVPGELKSKLSAIERCCTIEVVDVDESDL